MPTQQQIVIWIEDMVTWWKLHLIVALGVFIAVNTDKHFVPDQWTYWAGILLAFFSGKTPPTPTPPAK